MNKIALKKLCCALFTSLWMAILLSPASLAASTLHAFLVVDTSDWALHESFVSDLQQMTHQVQTIVDATGMELNFIKLEDQDVTRENVLQSIANTSVEPDDMVLLYFSSHGFRTEKKDDQWPFLYFNPQSEGLDFSLAIKLIQEKKPRFLLALADCCNSFIDDYTYNYYIKDELAFISRDKKKNNYKKLFVDSRGSIIISSSSPGQYSIGYPDGGLYTQCFLINLQKMVNDSTAKVEWKTLLDSISSDVVKEEPEQVPQFLLQVKDKG
jgi:hypothetical protein